MNTLPILIPMEQIKLRRKNVSTSQNVQSKREYNDRYYHTIRKLSLILKKDIYPKVTTYCAELNTRPCYLLRALLMRELEEKSFLREEESSS